MAKFGKNAGKADGAAAHTVENDAARTAEGNAARTAEQDAATAERDANAARNAEMSSAEREALKAEEMVEALAVARLIVRAEDAGHIPGPAIAASLDALKARYRWIKSFIAEPLGRGYDVFLIASKEEVAKTGQDGEPGVPAHGDGPPLTPDGKFQDPELERQYQEYITRKQRAGAGDWRDRSDWKSRSDWWKNESPVARGNAYNKSVRDQDLYPYHELNLEDGTRLDSYVTGSTPERISRKATDFNKVTNSDFQAYLDEFTTKYPEGKVIRSNAYPELDGTRLQGVPILEVPAANLGPEYAARRAELEALARAKGVEIRYTPE